MHVLARSSEFPMLANIYMYSFMKVCLATCSGYFSFQLSRSVGSMSHSYLPVLISILRANTIICLSAHLMLVSSSFCDCVLGKAGQN